MPLPVNIQWWSRFKMHTLHVWQCHERGGVIASHTVHIFHNFGSAFVGRVIRSPNMLVLHIITATILLPMLYKMNVPNTKFNKYRIEWPTINSGNTMNNSNQYVIGMATVRNSVVPISLSVLGKNCFRTLIVRTHFAIAIEFECKLNFCLLDSLHLWWAHLN